MLEQFRHLHTDIYANREFVEFLPNRGKFFDHEEKRERDLILIDYDDPSRNVYEVTEEWAFQRKTNALVQKHIGSIMADPGDEFVIVDRSTIETIKMREEGKATKVSYKA